MKLLNKNFELNEPGTIEIIPQEPDDLWVLYNLIANGDIVAAKTTRKVYNLGSCIKNKPKRVTLTIPLLVTSTTDFDNDSSTMRVQGKNMDEANEHIEYGSFHTLTLERNKGFELFKNIWDSTSCRALFKKPPVPDLAVVLIKESLAEVYLVGNGLTKLCSKIEARRKKSLASSVCFQDLFDAFVKHVDFRRIKTAMIVSAGKTKDRFQRFLLNEARRLRMQRIVYNESRIIVAEFNEEDLNLKEVLNDKVVMDMIKQRKVVSEIGAFRKLWDLVDKDSSQVCYGAKHVEAAHEMAAIETLLITDDLYRSSDVETRLKYTNFAESVKKGGSKVMVYSSMDVSAPQLAQLTGIAAILRFPLPYLDDDVGV